MAFGVAGTAFACLAFVVSVPLIQSAIEPPPPRARPVPRPRQVVARPDRARPVVHELIAKTGDADEGVRWEAARQLVEKGPAVVDALTAALFHDDVRIRRTVAWCLGEVKCSRAAEMLIGALDDGDGDVCWKAAQALTQLEPPPVDQLLRVAQQGSLKAKRCATWALGDLREARAVDCLVQLLDAFDGDLRWKAARSLSQLGEVGVPALRKVLLQGRADARRCGTWALGKIGGDPAIHCLALALRDGDAQVRAKAIAALKENGTPRAMELLRSLGSKGRERDAGED